MMVTMNKWVPTTNPRTLRRLGKTQEEIGELVGELAGYIERSAAGEPTPTQGLSNEIADVYAQFDETCDKLCLEIPKQPELANSRYPAADLLSACGAVSVSIGRCIIQGLDGIDPANGETNQRRLARAIAIGYSSLGMVVDNAGLSREPINERRAIKRQQMHEWEALFTDDE